VVIKGGKKDRAGDPTYTTSNNPKTHKVQREGEKHMILNNLKM